ncbi:MAG: homoserine dehydrogenase [Acidimicrobiia bacterium]|nr:homoserine dehydrogenase [Acidimicrobiia bacterium]
MANDKLESSATPDDTPPSTVRVGLLGCGHVGAALVGLIDQRNDAIERASGVRFEIAGIAVRNPSRQRDLAVNPDLFTTDAAEVVGDPSVDVVVEVIGGIEPARSLIVDALKAGKPVVTANKELLANVGSELYALAAANEVDLLFEAAAAGAIPIVRPLRESLLGEDVRRVIGIVNGTTNYILSRMAEDGADYHDALAEAQQRGFAERDPTADVEGYDAGAKAAIMASLAFGVNVVAGDVYHEGISAITQEDIVFARHFGYTIKLLAIAERFDGPVEGVADGQGGDREAGATGEIGVTVYPAMVPNTHPLASVRGSFNAVFVECAAAGDLMFYGRGAGGAPTASAVLGDLIDASANLRKRTFRPVPSGHRSRIRSVDLLKSAYYINLETVDAPGVLAEVANAFGRNQVSIRSMEQHGMADQARIAFITHTAYERDVQQTLRDLRALDVVKDIGSVLRVIGS